MSHLAVWISPRVALSMIGQKKLCQLTNEIGQQEPLGTGDGVTLSFVSPFAFGSDIKVYVDSVISGGYTLGVDQTKGERIVVQFAVAPALATRLTVSSTDSVNADNLDLAFLRAQELVRGCLDSARYVVPMVATETIFEPLLGWASAIAWYLLATDPRRPRLLEAYPEIEKRYVDVYGGVDSDLKRVAKGTFSLRGILSSLNEDTQPSVGGSDFISNEVVYTVEKFRGVN